MSIWLTAVFGGPGYAAVDQPDESKSSPAPESVFSTAELFRATDVQQTAADPKKIVFDSATANRLTVICFLGTECPLAKLYGPRLESLAKKFSGNDVRFIGLNSNRQDSAEELLNYVRQQGITFAVGKDPNNLIADRFNIQRTPEVIVVDAKMNIRYRGRIDDQYAPGVARSSPQRHDLKIAIEELLADQPVTVPETQPEGCLLGRVTQPDKTATVTFAQHVAPVLNKHCVECHHAGDIGPFSLTDYDEVAGWGDMMIEVIDNGRMPPWHADPDHGDFANQRLMRAADKKVIRDWVAQGMPLGDATQIPPSPEYTTGWQLPREPDVVLAMRKRPFAVPADGTVEYQYFVVDPKLDHDVWITAAEVIPGNRAVVHHSIVFIRPPDGTRMQGIGWLAAYVPGQRMPEFNPKRARKVPAGSRLVFQQHYTPNGTAATDITKIGLLLADDPQMLEEELVTLVAKNQRFEIQPEKSDQSVRATLKRIPAKAKLLGISPHMHFRGDQFAATTILKNTKRRQQGPPTTTNTLLRVPAYDFNWQHNYVFSDPIAMDDLKRIDVEFKFDNSSANPFNPDPKSYVTWGDQTWEEMAIAFFDVAQPIDHSNGSNDQDKDSTTLQDVAPSAEAAVQIAKKTNELFERFDANQDGAIVRSELPLAVRVKFNVFDADGDQSVSRQEIEAQFRKRLQ